MPGTRRTVGEPIQMPAMGIKQEQSWHALLDLFERLVDICRDEDAVLGVEGAHEALNRLERAADL